MSAIYQNFGGFSYPAPTAQGTPATIANNIPARTAITPPGYGVNFLRDLFFREDVKQAILEEYFKMNKFVAAGIIGRNSGLDGREGGVTVTMPFFQEMNFVEEDIDSNEYWGASGQGYLTPQRTQTSQFVIPRVSKGFAFGADDISRIASGEDPMMAMMSYIAGNLQTFRTNHVLRMLDAAFGSGGPLAAQSITNPVPAGSVATAAESISVTQVVKAKALLGERSSRLTHIAMHSDLYHWLEHQSMLVYTNPAGFAAGATVTTAPGGFGDPGGVPMFAGLRVIVDDQIARVPTGTANKPYTYPVYLFGQNAIQEGIQKEFSVELGRNILSKQDISSCHYIYAMGIPGISWTGSPAQIAAGSVNAADPELPAAAWTPLYPHASDISTPTNWTLRWSHRQYVPIVRMLTYSPFSGTY